MLNIEKSVENDMYQIEKSVYIGLDFPPNDKYADGWRKTDVYLQEKELNNGFHKLVVCRRDVNLGIVAADSNITRLYDCFCASDFTYKIIGNRTIHCRHFCSSELK